MIQMASAALRVPGALGKVEEDLGDTGGVDFGFGFPQDGVRNDTKWHPLSAYSGLSS